MIPTDMRPLSSTVHDLVRLRAPEVFHAEGLVPSWVIIALRRAPWAVVRRGPRGGLLPVGVRGPRRRDRCAGFVNKDDIVECLRPEQIVGRSFKRQRPAPALAALARVGLCLEGSRLSWGPGGSVGFDLATGVPTLTAASDLDLVLRQVQRLEVAEAVALQSALTEAAAPVRVDTLLETPAGGVLLADLATAPGRVLVRTPDGPRLLVDPWLSVGRGPPHGPAGPPVRGLCSKR